MALTLAVGALAFESPVSKVAQQAVKAAAPAVLAASLFVAPAFAGSGQSVFDGNCAACHAGGQNVIMPGKTLEKEVRARTLGPAHYAVPDTHCPPPQALTEYLDGGFNEKAVMYQVTNGKGAMPAFGGRLSDADIAAVACALHIRRTRPSATLHPPWEIAC
jgi:cytochrome c6